MPPASRHAEPQAAHADPLARILGAEPATVSQPVVQGVCQDLLRGVLHGVLHEERIGDWYREAAHVGGSARPFHELLPAVLERLDGVEPAEARWFAQPPGEGALAEWGARLYALCRRALPPSASAPVHAPRPSPAPACPLPRRVRRMASTFEGLDGIRLLLHGSLATCDPTPYSDVDTLLVVGDAWLERAESLGRLRRIVLDAQRWLYYEDPTQHHGFMLVTALDLARYPGHYFPLELLGFAVALTRGDDIAYRPRPSSSESRQLLGRVGARVQALAAEPDRAPATRHALKSVLSEMMLLPSYFLQSRGEVLYKRDSFAAVRPLLSPSARSAIDLLSAWRREWRRSPWERAYRALGEWMPRPVAIRVMGRVRSFPTSDDDRARWSALMPHARDLARELAALAEAPGT